PAARRGRVTSATGREVLGIRVPAGRARGVMTRGGEVDADTVVIAAGAWSGALAARTGTPVPAFPVRHQAWVTAPMDWLTPTFPVVRVPDRLAYLRPEVG